MIIILHGASAPSFFVAKKNKYFFYLFGNRAITSANILV
jgi:hypothetical protein